MYYYFTVYFIQKLTYEDKIYRNLYYDLTLMLHCDLTYDFHRTCIMNDVFEKT